MVSNFTFHELVERIKSLAKIEEIAEKLGIHVDTRGKGKRALCPFHEDHKPSLELYSDHYHCMSCNAHGNVFELVKQIKNFSFKQAVEWLAEILGLQVPGYSIESRRLNRNFRNSLEFAYKLFKTRNNDKSLKEWSNKRQIDCQQVKNAGILSLNRNPLISSLEEDFSRYSLNEWGALADAGLVKFDRQKKYKEDRTFLDLDSLPKDVFWYKSILFPIQDEYGNIQGFAFRNNDDEKSDYKYPKPKYRYNSGFKRSENLYRIDKVFEEAHKSLKESKTQTGLHQPFQLFIAEGFMDALRLESLGFDAIAVLGNYLGGKVEEANSQLGKLKKLADTLKSIPLAIHLFFDKDDAGRNGMKKAISQLLELRSKIGNVVFFDIIVPGANDPGKDPDELLKDIRDNTQAAESLNTWSYPVLDFVIADILDCDINQLESEWEKLSPLQLAQLKRRLELRIPPGAPELCQTVPEKKVEPPPWVNFYLEKEKYKEKEKWNYYDQKTDFSITDFQIALSLAENAYKGYDYPFDLGSWERLKKAGSLLKVELADHLREGDPLEPFVPVLNPREGGGTPRLRTLPCAEDMVLQEYVLKKLLTFALEYTDIIPAVIHQVEKNESITVGRKEHITGKGQVVSFAYQVNESALKTDGSIRTTLFLDYSSCWRSFNDFVLKRVSRSPQEVLFPARMDIRRFYDTIPIYSVNNVLKPALEEACRKQFNYPLVPGIDKETDKVEDRAAAIFDWICRQSFHYPFYSPQDGDELKWPDRERGIPQGPNLSAWLANIVLFPVDKKLSGEVERINEEYREDHPGCPEDFVVATYARYVDDVILIAPDNSALVKLQQIFISEINKIGLTLSPKTDSLDPKEVKELREWLTENRGLGARPSGPWEPSLLRSTSNLFKSMWVQTIDRKQALALLHDNDIDRGGFDKKEIKQILEIVCQKSEEIRYGDYRSIAKRLWQIVCDEFDQETTSLESIIHRFKKEWESLVENQPQNNEEKTPGESKTDTKGDSILDDYREPLDKTRHLHSWLEGIQALLLSRMDRSLFIDEHWREKHFERKEKFSKWILDGLIKGIIKQSGIEEQYIEKFKFAFELRRLTLIQISRLILEKTQFQHRKDMKFSLLNNQSKRTLNAVTRFSFSALGTDDLEVLRSYQTFEKRQGILLFHEVIERLNSGNPLSQQNGNSDPLSPTASICEKYLKEKDTSFLAQTLYCLCPHEHNNEVKISQGAQYAAIQVFANCISDQRQLTYLKKRPHLVIEIIGEDVNKIYILPHPEQIALKAIQIVKIPDHKRIEKKYFLLNEAAKQIDDTFEKILPDESNLFNDWEKKESKLDGIQCYYKDEGEYNLPILNEEFHSLNNEKKLKVLLDAFTSLKEIPSIENYLITPFHLIEKEGEYSVFSPQFDSETALKTLAFGSTNYSTIEGTEVPERNAHLWRIGIAISGLLNLNKEFSHTDRARIQKDPALSSDENEFLSRSVLIESLAILKGNKYWSKPRPMRQGQVEENRNNLPWAVENCLSLIKFFLEPHDFQERLAIWLVSRATYLLMAIHCENELLHPNGGISYIFSELAAEIFSPNQAILKQLSEFSKLDDNYEKYRRFVASCIIGIDVLDGLKAQMNNVEIQHQLMRVKTAFQIRAINNLFKGITLELKKIVEESFKDCFLSIPSDLKILGSDTDVQLIHYIEANADHSQFFAELDRILSKSNTEYNKLYMVTPPGWIYTTWTLLCKIIPLGKRTELKELGERFVEIYDVLSIADSENDQEFPWLFNDETIEKIETKYNDIFNNGKESLSKRIEELVDLKVKPCKSSHFSMSPDQGIYTFATEKSGNWNMKPWQFHIELMQGDNRDKYERKIIEDRPLNYWTETWHRDKLLGVSILSESYRHLFNTRAKVDTSSQDSSEEKERTKPHADEIAEASIKTEEKTVPGLDVSISTPLKQRHESEKYSHHENNLSKLNDLQYSLWKQREHRFGRHIRAAFCQFDLLTSSYVHPLKELCEQHNEKFAKELKENPWKYTEEFGLEKFKPKKLFSCTEYRRRKILEEVLRACAAFKVDLLLLPEYSVRPETVNWLKEQLKDGRFSDTPLTVWCGTYRLPYWKNKRYVASHEIEPMASPLHVINSDYSWVRGKKYPAVAFSEMFNPYKTDIEPLYKIDPSKEKKQNCKPGEFVLELICSENFALTSPLNRNAILQAYYQLERIWGGIDAKDLERIQKTFDNDLKSFSRWTSLSPSFDGSTPAPTDWLIHFPRRTVLFVPAMTSRVEDFQILGQTNLLAGGICTVLCNAVYREYAKGGSCFIGHDSWSNKHDPNPYSDNRIGPYNGIYPGIYRKGEKNEGALGSTEQAVVIADIDPIYMNEGKPRHQLLQHPLQLVAHLPIIEISHPKTDKKDSNENSEIKVNCACKKDKMTYSEMAEIQRKILNIFGYFPEKKSSVHKHIPEKEISDTLKMIAEKFKDSWLEARWSAYKNNSMVKLSGTTPPALYDFLPVFTGIPDSKDENEIRKDEQIEIPPFTSEMDSIDLNDIQKNS